MPLKVSGGVSGETLACCYFAVFGTLLQPRMSLFDIMVIRLSNLLSFW